MSLKVQRYEKIIAIVTNNLKKVDSPHFFRKNLLKTVKQQKKESTNALFSSCGE